MVGFRDIEVGTGSRFQTVTVDVADNPDDGGPVLNDAGKDAVADGALGARAAAGSCLKLITVSPSL